MMLLTGGLWVGLRASVSEVDSNLAAVGSVDEQFDGYATVEYETFAIDEDGNEISADEPYPWPDREERVAFATDTAQDIVEWHDQVVFDGGRYVELRGSEVATSSNGLDWVSVPTTGLDGFGDFRGLVASEGTFATVVVVWGEGADQGTSLFVATSPDAVTWAVQELPVPDDVRESIYPVDLALDGDMVSVLAGVDGNDVAGFTFTGPIGGPFVPVAIPGEGAPASVVAVDGTFAVGVQIPGDDVPETAVWTSSTNSEWAVASPLPDNLTGQLHAVGDLLIVTGFGYSEVEVFSAISDDAGASWERAELDPYTWRVAAGPDGLLADTDNGLTYSTDGRKWTPLPGDLLLNADAGPETYVEVRQHAIGANEVIMSRFEAEGDDESTWDSAYFAIELPE